MHWDLTWDYPLLIDDNGIVVAKDNGNGNIIKIVDGISKEEFIKRFNSFWIDLIAEMDGEIDNEEGS